MKQIVELTDENGKTFIFATLSNLCAFMSWNYTALVRKDLPFKHEGYIINRKEIQR